MTSNESLRLDLWLWYARFYKTRSLASRACEKRRIRINGAVVRKASRVIRIGDFVTLPHRGRIKVIRIAALGERRGPASEAVGLYTELAENAAADAPGPQPQERHA